MVPLRSQIGWLGIAMALGLTMTGCSAHRHAGTAADSPSPASAPPPGQPAASPQTPDEAAGAEGAPAAAPTGQTPAERPSLHSLCHQQSTSDELLDETRRRLEETFCSATLWFDSLLGGEPDVDNARHVYGRVELSTLYTQADGLEPKARLRLRYDLPNLERRVNLFLGRDDRDEFVEDRREGFAIRSSVFGLENQDRWLAGLGYRPPGRWASKLDFRVGSRLKTAPEVFAQARYTKNTFVGRDTVWRFRETVFWENREGFGSTTSLDFDHVLRPDLVLRWGNVGTVSESTEGLSWRSAWVLYHHLERLQAVAGEIFMRGSTAAEVPLREYGARLIYRRPIGKPYLFGNLVGGYTWPRRDRAEPREGSALVGAGLELHFGREPRPGG